MAIKSIKKGARFAGQVVQELGQTAQQFGGSLLLGTKMIGEFGQAIAQAPQRAITAMALEPTSEILSSATGQKVEPNYTPSGRLEQALLGTQPIEGLFKQSERLSGAMKPYTPPGFSEFAAPVAIAGLAALDVSPLVGGKAKIKPSLVKSRLKDAATQIERIRTGGTGGRVIGQYTDDVAKQVAKLKIAPSSIDDFRNAVIGIIRDQPDYHKLLRGVQNTFTDFDMLVRSGANIYTKKAPFKYTQATEEFMEGGQKVSRPFVIETLPKFEGLKNLGEEALNLVKGRAGLEQNIKKAVAPFVGFGAAGTTAAALEQGQEWEKSNKETLNEDEDSFRVKDSTFGTVKKAESSGITFISQGHAMKWPIDAHTRITKTSLPNGTTVWKDEDISLKDLKNDSIIFITLRKKGGEGRPVESVQVIENPELYFNPHHLKLLFGR